MYYDFQDYKSALKVLDSALRILLEIFDKKLLESNEAISPDDEQKYVAAELAKFYGLKGGIYRRMQDNTGAYECYFEGSKYEDDKFGIANTYNQLNEITYALLAKNQTVEVLKDRVMKVLKKITKQEYEVAGTRGGMDGLGRILVTAGPFLMTTRELSGLTNGSIQLLGVEASRSTLGVLRMITNKLKERGDPGTASMKASVRFLEEALRNL